MHVHDDCWNQSNIAFHVSLTGAKPHRLIDVTAKLSTDAAVFAEFITKYVPLSAFQNWIGRSYAFTTWNVALRSVLSECNLKGMYLRGYVNDKTQLN